MNAKELDQGDSARRDARNNRIREESLTAQLSYTEDPWRFLRKRVKSVKTKTLLLWVASAWLPCRCAGNRRIRGKPRLVGRPFRR